MKIAMIGHKRIPSREGGVEIVVEELSKRMVEKGNEVHVYNRMGHHVSGGRYDTEHLKNYKGIRIITIPTLENKNLNAFLYSFNATIRALFGRYDVIHYHAEGSCVMLLLAHLFRAKTVVTIHGLDWKRAKWGGFATKYLLLGEKTAVKYADEIIVLSQNVQNYFMDTYHRETNFISNGIQANEQREAQIITEKYQLKKDDYILYLARIVPEKGVHYLIDAFKKISTDKKLVIAGGSSGTGEYFDQISKLAAQDDRIIMTGFVQGEELQELYSNAYVYVLPSDIEGMPISLLEAMSYGNCCLTSDIKENSEIIEDKGVVFRKSDVSDLQNKLEYLIHNEDIVKTYKSEAGDFITKKYEWDAVVDRTLGLYTKA